MIRIQFFDYFPPKGVLWSTPCIYYIVWRALFWHFGAKTDHEDKRNLWISDREVRCIYEVAPFCQRPSLKNWYQVWYVIVGVWINIVYFWDIQGADIFWYPSGRWCVMLWGRVFCVSHFLSSLCWLVILYGPHIYLKLQQKALRRCGQLRPTDVLEVKKISTHSEVKNFGTRSALAQFPLFWGVSAVRKLFGGGKIGSEDFFGFLPFSLHIFGDIGDLRPLLL